MSTTTHKCMARSGMKATRQTTFDQAVVARHAGSARRTAALVDGTVEAALAPHVDAVVETVRGWTDLRDLRSLRAALPRLVAVVRSAVGRLDGSDLGVGRATFACRFADLVAPVLCRELWTALIDAGHGASTHPGHEKLVNLAVHFIVDTLLIDSRTSDREIVERAGWALAGL